MSIARPGSVVGAIGAPHGIDFPVMETVVYRNVGLRGGIAPARAYIPELLEDVLEGRINPGLVFDFETKLEGLVEAYRAMDSAAGDPSDLDRTESVARDATPQFSRTRVRAGRIRVLGIPWANPWPRSTPPDGPPAGVRVSAAAPP
jgi:hypothetical protein